MYIYNLCYLRGEIILIFFLEIMSVIFLNSFVFVVVVVFFPLNKRN